MTTLNLGKCEYDREGVGRCQNTATRLYYRNAEKAAVCDRHKMGDGKDGRRDWGWKEIEIKSRLTDQSDAVGTQNVPDAL